MKKILPLCLTIISIICGCCGAAYAGSDNSMDDVCCAICRMENDKPLAYSPSTAVEYGGETYLVSDTGVIGSNGEYVMLHMSNQNGLYDVSCIGFDEIEIVSIWKTEKSFSRALSLGGVNADVGDTVYVTIMSEFDNYKIKTKISKVDKMYYLENCNGVNGAAVISEQGEYLGMYINGKNGPFVVPAQYIGSTIAELTGTSAGTPQTEEEPVQQQEEEYEAQPVSQTTNNVAQTGQTPLYTLLVGFFILIAIVTLVLVYYLKNQKGNKGVAEFFDNGDMPVADNNVVSTGRYCIVGRGGYFEGQKMELKGDIIIGRSTGRCNMCYPPDTSGVSGVHCRLSISGGVLTITDLDSSYGTYVNGNKLLPNVPMVLNTGDKFYLAGEKNTFTVTR